MRWTLPIGIRGPIVDKFLEGHLFVTFDGKACERHPWNKATLDRMGLSLRDKHDLELWETIQRNGNMYFLETA